MSITIGIVDVLFVQADAVKTQGSVSASVSRAEASPRAADVESVRQHPRLPPVSVNCCGRRPCMPLCRVGKREQCSQALHSGLAPVANLQQQTAATNARPGGSGCACSRLARHARRLTRPAPPLCKQRVETRLGDEVGDNGTRLPAPSLDVRGPLACANIAPAGTAARLIRQRSAQVLAPARLAAELGGRAVRPGGPMAGAWRHVVPRTTGTRARVCCLPSCLTLTPG
jgi:hypothetical protein